MESASSLEHLGTTAALQPAYGDYQIGPFENFHQVVEETLIVVGSRLKIFLQYALRFADGLKTQLLIGHSFSPIRLARVVAVAKEKKRSSRYLGISTQFLFQCGTPLPNHQAIGVMRHPSGMPSFPATRL
jgi:hypothetical protein